MSDPIRDIQDLIIGGAFTTPAQYFFAIYADGHEERVNITLTSGEELGDAAARLAKELGALRIVLKPDKQEAPVPVE